MGKHSGRKKSHRKTAKKNNHKPPKPPVTQASNFVSEAGPGCYIARRDRPNEGKSKQQNPDWMIGWEDVDPEDFGIDADDPETTAGDNNYEVPDIALDPEDCTLTICNLQDRTKVAYVTVFETAVVGAHGKELARGSTTDNDGGESVSCVTFIVLCPPRVFAHLCYMDIPDGTDLSAVRIESDVSEWKKHPDPSDEHPFRIGFPLNDNTTDEIIGNGSEPLDRTSFLCTQGEDGTLTHFFSGNLHAIDFRCPVGTELLAVGDGVVVEAKDENTLTGIAVTNLFQWNSILIRIEAEISNAAGGAGGGADEESKVNSSSSSSSSSSNSNNDGGGPLFVEYVHISRSLVKSGDVVKRGQVIGYSGSVGFSPEPHLHFSAFRSSDADAPTVRVLFESSSSSSSSSTSGANGRNGEGDKADDGNDATGLGTPSTFLPRAGEWYNSRGIVAHPT
eukprot:jgi/Psemu1/198030/e_gw1.213.26.1